jgi:hypothetical protein
MPAPPSRSFRPVTETEGTPQEDLVARLRKFGKFAGGGNSLHNEAADEIERLRECLKEARAAANAFLRELRREGETAPWDVRK